MVPHVVADYVVHDEGVEALTCTHKTAAVLLLAEVVGDFEDEFVGERDEARVVSVPD